MAFALLFASSYFSTITPQGGSQNVIFVGSNYLTQGELYRLGLLTIGFCLLCSWCWDALAAFRRTVTQGHIGSGRPVRRRVYWTKDQCVLTKDQLFCLSRNCNFCTRSLV